MSSLVRYQERSVGEVNSCGDLKTNTRQAVYVKCNSEACFYNHCCLGKAVLLILSVPVALGIQHAMRMRRIFLCNLPGSTT